VTVVGEALAIRFIADRLTGTLTGLPVPCRR
jgi:hypothetical protein